MDQPTTSVPKNVTLWIKDGKNSVRVVQATQKKVIMASSGGVGGATAPQIQARLPQQGIRFVNASGLDSLVKEAAIIESAAGLTNLKLRPTAIAKCTPHMVALPVTNSSVLNKMSPFKSEPSILPKPPHVASSPMILSTPQRIVNLAASPRTPQNILSPASAVDSSLAWSTKRGHEFAESDFTDGGKRSKKGAEKGGKGLRHFSMKVCEKVQKKGVTSYNEVADELVAEFSDPQRSMSPTDQAYDQKNIRRRVYDALNVLMAMNIISKEKKEIRWLGLPTNSAQECQILEVEKQKRLERIRVKTQQLHELILQQIAFKNLVNRNKKQEKEFGMPASNSAIHLPFIIVNTSKKTVIDCSISSDKMEYLFTFDNTFEIHDDIEVLKRMGLTFGLEKGECRPKDLEVAKRMVPKSLESYVVQMSQGNSAQLSCTSIVAGPSGIRTGRPSSTMESSEGSDSRIQDGSDIVSQPDSQDVTDTEMVNVDTGSTRRTSRQSSVASDSLQLRLDVATTSDDEEFSESESDNEEDNESIVDIN